MTLEKLKQNLIYKCFFEKSCYDSLINHHLLEELIDYIEINDVSEFLGLLKYLIDEVYSYISTIYICDDYPLLDIIEDNIVLVQDYFNDPTDITIKRIIINSFLDNSKYIESIKELLESMDLEVKDINSYNDDECEKIISLITDIALCNPGGYGAMVFSNIGVFLDGDNDDEVYWFYNDDLDYYKECIIKRYRKEYQRIFRNYEKRKEYLSCLKID